MTAPEGDAAGAATLPAHPAGHPAKNLVARGSLLVLIGYGGSQAIRLGGNLILWRLLYPKAFGIMAIINVLMAGLAMFSDIGIGPSIIQNRRGDDAVYLNTAWTIQAVRGILLFLVSAVGAAPVARFYGEPSLASMIPVVGLGAAISGFNSTALFTTVRRVALGRLTVIDLSSQLSGLAVMVVVGFIWHSIWGIVFGGLVANAVRMILGHAILPGVRNRFLWDRPSAQTLLTFGRWIFVSTLLTFAVGQSDRLIFGKLIPIDLLGVYSIATVWSGLPTAILDRVFSSVLLPILSRLEHVEAEFEKAFREARTPSLLLAGWLCASLMSGGSVLIRFLYDQRAVDAGWITQVLSAGTWLLALETTNSTALLARGHAKWMAIGSAAKLVGMAVAIPLGFMLDGFRGAVIGFSASEFFRYLTSVAGGRSIRLRSYRQDIQLSAVLVVTTALGSLGGRQIHRLLAMTAYGHGRLGAFVEGLVILLIVGAGWLAVHVSTRRRPRTD